MRHIDHVVCLQLNILSSNLCDLGQQRLVYRAVALQRHHRLIGRKAWSTSARDRLEDSRAAWVEGVARAAYSLEQVATLLVLCEPGDVGRAIGEASADRLGRIYLYDTLAGGSGFAERLYEARADLVARATRLVEGCACTRGCPGCIGPIPPPLDEAGPSRSPTAKQAALAILRSLLHDLTRGAPP